MSVQQELEALGHKFQKIKLIVADEQLDSAHDIPEHNPERREIIRDWARKLADTERDLEGYKTPLALPSHNE